MNLKSAVLLISVLVAVLLVVSRVWRVGTTTQESVA